MKRLSENIFDQFSPSVLNKQEMSTVLGGKRRKPKSRDKDLYDEEDE